MKNIGQMGVKVWNRFCYIGKLIVHTPKYGLIMFLQLSSGFLSFAGLPMLIPVLNYMSGNGQSYGKKMVVLEKVLGALHIEPNFYSVLTIASIFILSGQLFVFISSLIAANAQVELAERYRKELFSYYSKADWLWLLDSRSGEMHFSVLREAEVAGIAHLQAQRGVDLFCTGFGFTAHSC